MPTLDRGNARALARALGVGRVALGAVAMVLPQLPLRPWVGEAAGDRAARLLARALGGRDIALGLGVLLALSHDAPVRGWVEAGGVADAGDVAVTLAHLRSLPRRGRWLVVAAATGGLVAARLAAPSVDGSDAPAS